ncbi:MAG: acylphosphatase [Chitinophagaceae bacterium]
MLQTISILVKGKVQGVYYRQSTREKALLLGIAGTVCNLPDHSVQIMATGEKEQLDKLRDWCRQGPSRAVVTSVEWQEEALEFFVNFKVLR